MLICSDLYTGKGCGATNRNGAGFCAHCGQALRTALQLYDAGDTLGHYRVLGTLGHGGFGAVYAAEHVTRPGSPLAIKAIFDPISVRELEHEFAVLQSLTHPNIPRYYEWFEHQGNGYLVMELVPGENLEHILARQPGLLPEAQVLDYALQLCDVVSYLHTRQNPILHLDIKPANIRLTPDGLIKLVDFGTVKQHTPATGKTLSSGATLAYAPIEQYGGSGHHTDPRSDLYSLGATLYHLLTGHEPLPATTRVAREADPLPPPHWLNPDLSPHVVVTVVQAMSLRQQDRHPDVASFKGALLSPQEASGTPISLCIPPALAMLYPPGTVPPPPVRPVTGPTVRIGSAPSPHMRLVAAIAAISAGEYTVALNDLAALLQQHPQDGTAAMLVAQLIATPAVPLAERRHAAELAGQVGDPRLGVVTLPPAMVALPAGSLVVGSSEAEVAATGQAYAAYYRKLGDLATAKQALSWPAHERNDQALTIAAFELARYPVTNAQYRRFIDAGGYDPAAPWWPTAAQAWLQRDDATPPDLLQRRTQKQQPAFWTDPRFGLARPNHPVVGVNWYEAQAFAAWLTQHLQDGWVYGLPSEAEWEYAARGTERRVYPWGADEPDAERANYFAVSAGPTAVGCFPAGATPDLGLLDMAGNVWEWTRNAYRPYPYDPQDGREDAFTPAPHGYTVRGGSWDNDALDLRTALREAFAPDAFYQDVGLRLARHRIGP